MARIVKMPRLTDTMEEGVITVWHKKEGDKIKKGELLAEIETDKATIEFESPAYGTILKILAKEGEAVPVGKPIAVVGEPGEQVDLDAILTSNKQEEPPQPQEPAVPAQTEAVPAPPSTLSTAQQPDGGDQKRHLRASPLARRLARQLGIPLEQIQGTGPQGRIIKRDIERAVEEARTSHPLIPQAKEEWKDVPLTQMRKTIARRLVDSKQQAPHYYLTVEVNAERLVETKERLQRHADVKITINDLIIMAVARALPHHPALNASWLDDRIRYYKHVHIGVAVAVEDGLVVPVIRFAHLKTLTQIAQEARELAEKARNRQLTPQEMKGNTFTVSNLGMFGIHSFTAIINPPDVAILAVGAVREVAVVENGQVRAGKRILMTLSCDHRVVDGATGARFLQRLKNYLEEPELMLL